MLFRSTLGSPCGRPSRVKWSAFAAYTGEPGMVENTVSDRIVGLPVAPAYGVMSASAMVPIASRPLPPSTVNVMGTRSTDTTSPIRPARSAMAPPSWPVKTLRSCALLLVGGPVVDEHGRLPRLRCQDVARDMHRQGDRPIRHVDALDGAAVDVPGERRVTGAAVGVLANPARTEHVAAAHFEQLALDFVGHRCPVLPWLVVRIGRMTDLGRSTEL